MTINMATHTYLFLQDPQSSIFSPTYIEFNLFFLVENSIKFHDNFFHPFLLFFIIADQT